MSAKVYLVFGDFILLILAQSERFFRQKWKDRQEDEVSGD
jgi:hypothetical protein